MIRVLKQELLGGIFGLQGEDLLEENNLHAISRYIAKNTEMTKERDKFGNTLLHYFVELISAAERKEPENREPVLNLTFANFLRKLIDLNPEAMHVKNKSNELVVALSPHYVLIEHQTLFSTLLRFELSNSQPLLIFLLLQGTSLGFEHIAMLEKSSKDNPHPALKTHQFFRAVPNITPRSVGIYLRHKMQLDTLILQGRRRDQIYHALTLPEELLCKIVSLFTGLTSREFNLLSTHVISKHEGGVELANRRK